MEATLAMVDGTSGAVGMKLGLRKCAVAQMRAGRARIGGDADTGRVTIGEVRRGEAYKYLGIHLVFGSKGKVVRAKVHKDYLRRTRLTWASPLKTKSKVRNHTSWCVGVVRYFLGPVRWSRSDLTGPRERF